MRVLAPGKINLHLRVGPVRADGFHPLLTWMCTVALFDTLDIRRAGGEGTILTIEPTDAPADVQDAAAPQKGEAADGPPSGRAGGAGKSAAVPSDGTNLVVRAASLWAEVVAGAGDGPTAARGYSIALGKRIPVGAGMGGGSSDAARTLIALNRLDGGSLSSHRLAELGARLGSDVPFFFHGPSSICQGRGEVVTPIARPRAKRALVFLPNVSLSTGLVYQRFDALRLGRPSDLQNEPDWAAWAVAPSRDLMSWLVNDLEAPAFDVCPELGVLRARLESVAGQPVRMSGSGSSLFSLFDDEAQARDAAERIRRAWRGRVETVALCPDVE